MTSTPPAGDPSVPSSDEPTPAHAAPPPAPADPAPAAPAARTGSFDPKSVNPQDWGIIGAGALAFIFSFVSYYTASVGPISASINAWHGFFGWFAMLCAVAGAGILAATLFAPQVQLPFPTRLATAGLFAVATLCLLLALFVIPGKVSGAGVNYGHGAGYWISFIVVIVGLVLSVLRLKATGGKLPWEKGSAAS